MKRVLIIGSCVSRDAFELQAASNFQIAGYVARTSLASSFSDLHFSNVDISTISSSFQRRMVQVDLHKELKDILCNLDFDFILLDVIDERFDLYLNGCGELCTLSVELLSSGFKPDLINGRIIKSGTEEFFQRWLVGWIKFVDVLAGLGVLDRLIVNRIFWSDELENGNGYPAAFDPVNIEKANSFIEKIYAEMDNYLDGCQFICFDKRLLKGAIDHKWGQSPFHYVADLYDYMISAISSKVDKFLMTPISDFSEAENIPLSAKPYWIDVKIGSQSLYAVTVELTCSPGVKNKQALISIAYDGLLDSIPDGFYVSNNAEVGVFRYLNTSDGFHETSFSILIPSGVKNFKIGVRSWWPDGAIYLEKIRVAPKKPVRPRALISVDVEALPGRASQEHVDRLIFGKFGNGFSAGIERICDIFDRYGVKATFFVDYATVPIHGKESIFRASRLLEDRGHDVQLHMHSEVLVRNMGWNYPLGKLPAFDVLDRLTARNCLEYGVSLFEENLGRCPSIFRPGGMKHSKEMFEAMKDVGIPYSSALYRRFHDDLWPAVCDSSFLNLENGIVEVPLDFALDPLVDWPPFGNEVRRISEFRESNQTVSFLLHSTSLLYRPRNESDGSFYVEYHEPYEAQLCKYLEYLSVQCEFVTLSELLGQKTSLRNVSFSQLYRVN